MEVTGRGPQAGAGVQALLQTDPNPPRAPGGCHGQQEGQMDGQPHPPQREAGKGMDLSAFLDHALARGCAPGTPTVPQRSRTRTQRCSPLHGVPRRPLPTVPKGGEGLRPLGQGSAGFLAPSWGPLWHPAPGQAVGGCSIRGSQGTAPSFGPLQALLKEDPPIQTASSQTWSKVPAKVLLGDGSHLWSLHSQSGTRGQLPAEKAEFKVLFSFCMGC